MFTPRATVSVYGGITQLSTYTTWWHSPDHCWYLSLVLHCTQRMVRKNVHHVHRMSTRWLPSAALGTRCTGFSRRWNSSGLLQWLCGRGEPVYAFRCLQKCRQWLLALSCLSVCLSAWNNLAPSGRIFIKFDISRSFWKSVQKIQVSLKSDKNNRYFTRRFL